MDSARKTPKRRALAIRHVPFEDLGHLGGLLVERGYQVEYLDAGVGAIEPDGIVQADLVVVLGGPIGAYETAAYPFLRQELDAIGARLAAQRPLLGICLGAQLIATALGAAVRPTGRKEIGYAPLSLSAAGAQSVLAPLAATRVLHWHGDQFDLPAGAPSLASTPGFPNQAFAIGDWVLGLQFHLEVDSRRIEQWLIGHANELAGAGLDPAAIRAGARAHGEALAKSGREVFGAWLDALPG
jgi:GMP synthase (glutamine-hydrolysing)